MSSKAVIVNSHIFELKLNPYELSIYVHLLKLADENGMCSLMPVDICSKSRVSLPTLYKIKQTLKRLGLIRIVGKKIYLTQI